MIPSFHDYLVIFLPWRSHWYEFNIWRRKSEWVSEVRFEFYEKTLKIPKVPIKNQLERNNGILFNSILTIALLKRAHFHYIALRCREIKVWFPWYTHAQSVYKTVACSNFSVPHKWFCGERWNSWNNRQSHTAHTTIRIRIRMQTCLRREQAREQS